MSALGTPKVDGVEVYAIGLVCASACAPAALTREQVERAVNLAHPTGISSQWHVSADPEFRHGQPNPCPCKSNPERRHWLLDC